MRGRSVPNISKRQLPMQDTILALTVETSAAQNFRISSYVGSANETSGKLGYSCVEKTRVLLESLWAGDRLLTLMGPLRADESYLLPHFRKLARSLKFCFPNLNPAECCSLPKRYGLLEVVFKAQVVLSLNTDARLNFMGLRLRHAKKWLRCKLAKVLSEPLTEDIYSGRKFLPLPRDLRRFTCPAVELGISRPHRHTAMLMPLQA